MVAVLGHISSLVVREPFGRAYLIRLECLEGDGGKGGVWGWGWG